MKIVFASSLLLETITSYSFSFISQSSLCLSAASIFSKIFDFLISRFVLIFGSINFERIIYKITNVSVNLETRKSQILENIEAAEKQREDSEMKLKEYEEIISKSKLEAKTIFNQAREKALKDINAKKEVLDSQIDEEISKAEEEIKTLRNSAPDKINKIAIETSSELIQKLIGAEVNNSSISAIVDDLSRRSGDKYYGS